MQGRSGNRVLLVEDESVLRKLISRYLVAAGYVVWTADDGLDAITKLRVALPDVIISDLNMPRMSGLEFLAVVRKRYPQIPIMVMSADPPDDMPGGVAADAYYQKNGYGFHRLPEAIANLKARLPLPTAAPAVDCEPVKARRHRNGHYLLDCEDCFREFSMPRVFHIERAENWTICEHCGKAVRFIVAQ